MRRCVADWCCCCRRSPCSCRSVSGRAHGYGARGRITGDIMALKLGIIGAGYIGTVHAKNLMMDGRVQIVGVADVVTNKAADLARLVGRRPFPSAEALLEAGV